MRVPTIDERFADFLHHPTLNRWLSLRERLVSQADFTPHAPVWRQLEDAFAAGCYDRVLELSDPLSRPGCLSPRFHFLVGVAAEETGDPARAAWEQQCTRACLRGMLQSGAGSPQDPYLCTYSWDSYDILRALGRRPQGQQLIQRDERWYDLLAADDGQDYWFDVTDILQAASTAADGGSLQAAAMTRGAL